MDSHPTGVVAKENRNNFHLLRFVAAVAVVAFHSNPSTLGPGHYPSWVYALGFPAYEIAVDTFFCISGYLVMGSLVERRDLAGFAKARFLRIVPGAMASSLLTVAAVGLFFGSLPISQFLSNSGTIQFVLRGSLPLFKSVGYLPGAFPDNPYTGLANPSLWTLCWEVRMYILLAAMWWIWGKFQHRGFGKAIVVAWIAACLAGIFLKPANPVIQIALRFGPMFLGGAAYRAVSHIVPPSPWAVASILPIPLLLLPDLVAFRIWYLCLLPALVVGFAHLPLGKLRSFPKWGDSSYGVYIYSFPIQQMIVALTHIRSPLVMAAVSIPTSVTAGYLSWHLLEKRLVRPRKGS